VKDSAKKQSLSTYIRKLEEYENRLLILQPSLFQSTLDIDKWKVTVDQNPDYFEDTAVRTDKASLAARHVLDDRNQALHQTNISKNQNYFPL
jgi:hypothetical protein